MKTTKRVISMLIVLVMVLSMLPLSVISAVAESTDTDSSITEGYPTILEGEQKTVEITETDREAFFVFTPEEDGFYAFYSMSDSDTYGYLLDSEGEIIYENDDATDDYDFRIEYKLTAGVEYIFMCRYYSSTATGSFDVVLEKMPAAESIAFTQGEDYTGYVLEKLYLSIEYTPSNCVKEPITFSSSDETVATVDDSGYVSLVSLGEAVITATTESGLTDEYTVTVVDYPVITAGEKKTVSTTEGRSTAYFSFTPNKDASYVFYSVSNGDISGCLYDSEGNVVVGSEDDEAADFRIECDLKAGEKYVLLCRDCSEEEIYSYDVFAYELVDPESIEIVEADELTGYIHSTCELTAQLLPQGCRDSVTWSSSDEKIATVNNFGDVSLISPGEVVITATTENGLTDTCKITVVDYPKIYVDEQKTVEITKTQRDAYFSFTPEEDGFYVFYSLTNEDTYGYLLDREGNTLTYDDDEGDTNNFRIEYELEAGKEYIYRCRYYSDTKTGSFDVRLEHLAYPESIEILEGDALTCHLYSRYRVTAKVLPTNAADMITYSTSDESIVTVDSYGYITTNACGSATVTATTVNGLSDSIEITVLECPEIKLDEPIAVSGNYNDANTYKFVCTEEGYYSFYSSGWYFETGASLLDGNMNWICEDEGSGDGDNFRIDQYLNVGVYYLDTHIYDFSEEEINTINVVKKASAESIEILQGDKVTGYVGEYLYLNYELLPEGCADESVVWESDNEAVVSIDEYGDIELVGVGTANITVTTHSGKTDTCEVTVIEPRTIAVDTETATLDKATVGKELFKFTAPQDGTYKFYSYGTDVDTYCRLYDADMYYLKKDDDSADDRHFAVSYTMKAGETYYYGVTLYDSENYSVIGPIDSLYVKVEKLPDIEKLEIVSYPTRMDYYEGFEYFSFYGLKVRVTLSDGNSYDWIYDDEDPYLGGYDISLSTHYDENDDYINSSITCGSNTINFEFNILENPVDHIELVSAPSHVYIENCGGYMNENESSEYYHYYVVDVSDTVIKIVYKDGTSVNAKVYDEVDEYEVDYSNNQYSDPWRVGKYNCYKVSYLGKQVEVPVTLIADPIDRIEIDKAPSREYVYGDYQYGYIDSEETYLLYPNDMTGLEFTVYYKDGTSKSYSYEDIDDDDCIAGYYYELDYNSKVSVGEMTVTFTYLNHSADYKINVVESDVESLKVTKLPDKTDYVTGYYVDVRGMEFTITYTDGTSDTVTVDDDNLMGYPHQRRISVGDYQVYIDALYVQESVTPRLRCFDKVCYIEGLNYVNSKEIEDIGFDNFNVDCEDMGINIVYTDGSTQSLVIEDAQLRAYDEGGYISWLLKTDNGLLSIDMYEIRDAQGNIEEYAVWLLDRRIDVEVRKDILGDADGDGRVSVLDATLIQQHLCELKSISENRAEFADADKDGLLTILDATYIQLYLAELIPEL